MTSGFGVDPAADGSSGTSSSDVRKIWGGLYTPGKISGCVVSTSATTMTYTVANGVVAISVATGEIILAPVAAYTVSTSAAPVSGTRTDIVYAQQRYPSIEGDATIVIGVGTSLPARAVELRRYIVSANTTNTDAAVATGGINFSIPYGATLGVLHTTQDWTNGAYPNTLTRKGHGEVTVPTDRRLRYRLRTTMYAQSAVGFDNTKYCEYGFLPNINGGDFMLWQTTGLHQSWATFMFEGFTTVSAGTHTVNYGMKRMVGPGQPMGAAGTDAGGYGREGTVFVVEDFGPVV